MEGTQVDYLSHCIEDSDLEKSVSDEDLLCHENISRGNAARNKSNKRDLETQDEEAQHPAKRYARIGERFFWSQSLVKKLLEFVKLNLPKLRSRNVKKSIVFQEIYEKLKASCNEPGLTLAIVKKKWHNMLDYHKKLLEIQRKTGKVRYYQFYDEVNELFHMYQISNEDSIEQMPPVDNMPQLIVLEPNMGQNGITISGENPSQQQCSISDLTTQLLENSSSDEDSDQEIEREIEREGKSARKSRNGTGKRIRPRPVERSIKDLVAEHKKMVYCELRKTRSMEKTCEVKDTLNMGILNAINKRTEVLERQQSSSYRINDIYAMLQKYECKLENMDTRLLKLETTMYRIESLLEKIVNKLNEK